MQKGGGGGEQDILKKSVRNSKQQLKGVYVMTIAFNELKSVLILIVYTCSIIIVYHWFVSIEFPVITSTTLLFYKTCSFIWCDMVAECVI